MACGSCSRTLPEGANFCPFCGREVRATEGEERRVVTVLFADIVGFTGLSENLDPERVKRLVDGAFERMIADIDAHGGRVDKILGDGILALFGAPVTHEDDPDRAIRAAISMQLSLAEFVADQNVGRPVEVRIGINTGEVVVGSIGGTDDYTAMGDVVNVAARLQALAPPGEIYIGDSTAARASDEILREAIDDFEVRGREQTERVWRVTGRQRGVPVTGLRSDLPFVGRTAQRELLHSIMGLVAGGRSAVVAVSGEPGAGKTRLVAEALHEFPGANAVIFAGICAPYGETNVWSPIASAIFEQMRLDTATATDQLRALSRAKGEEVYGFAPGDPVLGWFVEAVMHLAGHPSELDHVPPAQARETMFRLIVEGLRRRSQLGPVIVWIDDLQWADALLVDLLHRITRSLVDRPVLVITAQRDDVELNWPPPGDHPITVRMPLDPLTRPEADELVAAVIGSAPRNHVAANLFERSGGNPLFLAELAELAALEVGDPALPSSLRALIAARLDQLPSSQRAIIDNAAVLGTGSPVSALETFASVLEQPYSHADLDALVEAGMLDVDGHAWRFRSDVVREVAYDTLTKAVRAYRHAGTASVMAAIAGVPIERVAHHVASAAELIAEIGPVDGVPETITDDAIDVLSRAAWRSLDVGAFSQARHHATRAMGLIGVDGSVRREMLLVRGRASAERREAASARIDAQELLAEALDAGDRTDEGLARRLLGSIFQLEGDLDRARTELETSVQIFRELGDHTELAESLGERGFVEVFGGSLADAESILAEAEELADELGNRRASAWVREHQAWVAFLSGDVELAEGRLDVATAMFDELGDQSGRLWANALRAYLHFFERDFAAAESLAATVRADAAALGERWAPAMMDSLIAGLRLWTGRFAEAEELSRRALNEFRDLGDRFGIVQALIPRNRALVALGRTQEAERGVEEAVSLSEAFGDLALPTMAAAGTAVHLGLGERAVRLGESALASIEAMGANGSEVRTTLALGLCQVGRAEDALTTMLDVTIESPYLDAVTALASAMIGDHQRAVEAADRVIADDGSTYLDQVLADVAAAAALAGDGDDDLADDRLARAAKVAADAGDVVSRDLVHHAQTRILERNGAESGGSLGVGWRRLIDVLSTSV